MRDVKGRIQGILRAKYAVLTFFALTFSPGRIIIILSGCALLRGQPEAIPAKEDLYA